LGLRPTRSADRFYRMVTDVPVSQYPVLDKLIDDEVMTFFARDIGGPGYRRLAMAVSPSWRVPRRRAISRFGFRLAVPGYEFARARTVKYAIARAGSEGGFCRLAGRFADAAL